MGQALTANKQYDYNTNYYMQTLKDWVNICIKQHRVMFPNMFNKKDIQKGDYYFDSYTVMIGSVFSYLRVEKNINIIRKMLYWMENKL
jgi:hypothetical protein